VDCTQDLISQQVSILASPYLIKLFSLSLIFWHPLVLPLRILRYFLLLLGFCSYALLLLRTFTCPLLFQPSAGIIQGPCHNSSPRAHMLFSCIQEHKWFLRSQTGEKFTTFQMSVAINLSCLIQPTNINSQKPELT
jgi:hypothetical protein